MRPASFTGAHATFAGSRKRCKYRHLRAFSTARTARTRQITVRAATRPVITYFKFPGESSVVFAPGNDFSFTQPEHDHDDFHHSRIHPQLRCRR
jgi:hypothetical protein